MTDLYFLLEYPIFRDFGDEDLAALSRSVQELRFAAGAAVCHEGEAGDAMYVVKEGVLDIQRLEAGHLHHINMLSAGEFFGEMALIDGSPRSADVLVKEDALLIKLPVEAYLGLKKEAPATALKVADVLLKTLSHRVRRSTKRALENERKQGKESV